MEWVLISLVVLFLLLDWRSLLSLLFVMLTILNYSDHFNDGCFGYFSEFGVSPFVIWTLFLEGNLVMMYLNFSLALIVDGYSLIENNFLFLFYFQVCFLLLFWC